MNGNSLLLDTNIVLYLLGGDKTLVPILENKKLIISFITELEMLSYKLFRETERLQIKRFLKECIIVDVNSSIKEYAIDIRKKYSLKLPDCIIAATAKQLKVPLISADKEFSKVDDMEIIFYQK